MVKLIMGVKGSGKTKQLIELINQAAHSDGGDVVCIERGANLTYDIHYKIRLIKGSDYDLTNYERLRGFISGLHAGNYDISQVFIDSLCKIVPSEASEPVVTEFLQWLDAFGEKNGIRFTVTISADIAKATEGMKKYF